MTPVVHKSVMKMKDESIVLVVLYVRQNDMHMQNEMKLLLQHMKR